MNGRSRSIDILHVEDDPDLAETTAEFLEQDDGIRVEFATNPEAGLEYLSEHEVNCIVSDYDLPGQSGIEFLETVRSQYPDLPFILFTGKGSEEVASEAISAGVSDYLQKTPGIEAYDLLANRIENAVSQYRAHQRVAEQARTLSILRDINRALVQASTIEEIDEAVTRILAGTESYEVVWSGEYDEDWDRVVPRTVAGADEDQLGAVSLSGRSTAAAALTAIQDEELVVTRPDEPSIAVWNDGESVPNGESAAVVPLNYQGERHGFLVLYAEASDTFDGEERGMLDEIAGDVAQASHAAAVRADLREHKTAVEAVPEGVFLLDDEACIDLINAPAAGIINREPGSVVGEPFPTFVEAGIFDESIMDWYVESLREMLSTRSDRQDAWFETAIHTPDGEKRVVEVHLALRPFEDEFRGTVGILRDVTERKVRERELERHERIVEGLHVPWCVLDETCHITDASDALSAVTGFAVETLLGRHMSVLIDEEQLERGEAAIHELLAAEGDPDILEVDLVTAEEDRLPCTIHFSRLQGEDELEEIVGILHDLPAEANRPPPAHDPEEQTT